VQGAKGMRLCGRSFLRACMERVAPGWGPGSTDEVMTAASARTRSLFAAQAAGSNLTLVALSKGAHRWLPAMGVPCP